MPKIKIISPMARGNGAYVVHRILEQRISEYCVRGYHSCWTLFPFSLPVIASPGAADLIHTTPDYAAFFHRNTTLMIITFHNYVLDRWMRPFNSMIQRIHYATDLLLWTRIAVKRARLITAVSQYTARLVQRDLGITRPIRVIYNGINIDNFTPMSSSQSSRKQVRVLFSGNLTRRKGAHWLPLIAKQLQKNVCIYYTQGLRTQNNLAPNSKLQPIGPVPFKDMANRYREMDLLLLPSVREGFGLAVAEAMACGLPVVASDCSAIPELIDEGKGGFLCPVGDINAFAEKINLLADSPKLRSEMGEYNRTKVEKMFTLDRMVKEYQDLFQEVLG
jgi:glycosyltransferase involved in cell wall biosynthesis